MGVHIVSGQWLTDSAQVRAFRAPGDYPLVDAHSEKQYKMSLAASWQRAASARSSASSRRPLFADWSFVLMHADSPSEELSRADLAIIVECAGGRVLDALPSSPSDNHTYCLLYTSQDACHKDEAHRQTPAELAVCKLTVDAFVDIVLHQSCESATWIVAPSSNGKVDSL